MKKAFLIFIIFISFFYLSIQYVSAAQYACDPTPKLIYGQCASDCAIKSGSLVMSGAVIDCRQSYCSLNEVAVGCRAGSASGTEDVFCEPLTCGSCGVATLSGDYITKDCYQSTSCDSSCTDVVSNNYGYSDTNIWGTCEFGYGSTSAEQPPNSGRNINAYNKKTDGTLCTYNGQTSTCKSGVCQPLEPACSDGTPENSCCATPGEKCLKNTITGLYSCTKDSSCPTCLDGDAGKDTTKATTCKDTAGGLCDAFQSGGSKCTDTCASSGSVNEYYCSNNACKSETITCGSTSYCTSGKCDSGSGGGGGGGGNISNPNSGGCSWLYSGAMGIGCSSGCPTSYPNQQQVCCDTNQDKGCNGGPACASYNPTVGETPCCYATGYKTCTKQEACTATGCQNVCTTADKTSDLYCSKCNSCQDGIQNCGEPTVDKCGEPCTVSQTTEYVKWSPSYCWQVCANNGATCVGVMGSSGQYYPQGCSQGWTGNCKCSKTTTDFNPKTILESNL